MQLKPVTRKSLSDAVFEQLSSEIVHGRMVPGVSLPSERTLCDLLRVNRGAVREGLKRLSQAGLIVIQHGGGAKVLDYKQSGNLDLLTRLLFRSDGTIDLQVARSAMEMRAAMAPDIARLCARRRQPEHIHQVFELVAAMAARPDDLPALQTLALQFWDVLVDGSVHMGTWTERDARKLELVRYARQNGVALVERDHDSGESVPGLLVNRWGPGNWSGSGRPG